MSCQDPVVGRFEIRQESVTGFRGGAADYCGARPYQKLDNTAFKYLDVKAFSGPATRKNAICFSLMHRIETVYSPSPPNLEYCELCNGSNPPARIALPACSRHSSWDKFVFFQLVVTQGPARAVETTAAETISPSPRPGKNRVFVIQVSRSPPCHADVMSDAQLAASQASSTRTISDIS